jgi:hypothetical protein
MYYNRVDKMRSKLTFIVIALLVAVLCGSVVMLGQAEEISVGLYDPVWEGVRRDSFNIGERIRVIAESTDKPITVIIKDPYGNVVHYEVWYGYKYNKVLSGMTRIAGYYSVEASSPMKGTIRRNYACVWYRIIPEIPLGTIGVAATMFAVLGFYGLMHRRKRNI